MGTHYVCLASPNIILILLVVKFVGKYCPVKVMLSPPTKFRYWFGDAFDKKQGSYIDVSDSEFGMYPKTEYRLGMNEPQVAF